MQQVSTKVNDFFDHICEKGHESYDKLIQEFNIDYKDLIPYASWSDEKYQRICLRRDEKCELILICWMPDQQTEVHDHNGQSCYVYFPNGAFEEEFYEDSSNLSLVKTNQVSQGEVTSMHGEKALHRLKNASGELAMTLHLYANPIDECTIFDTDESVSNQLRTLTYDLDLDESASCKMLKEITKFQELSENLLNDEETNPVSERIAYEDLHEKLQIGLSEAPISDEEYYSIVNKVLLATPKTSSKLFFNQLFGGRQPKAVLGDLLAVMLNNSMYTYKVAGVQVGIEKEILHHVISKLNYPSTADGTFPTGGSMSNFMAMLMGRDKKDTAGRLKGIQQNLVAYTSIESHYSVEKNASFVGIGRDNVRKIPSDAFGKMIPAELDKAIVKDLEDGKTPFFLNATAGTTVLGAFDAFDELGEVAKKHNVWFHIDGAYSGAALFSSSRKKLLVGAEHSDSFSFNPHKMLGTPMTCSIIVVKEKKYLENSFSNSAEYLYQTDQDNLNLGKTSFQCGRRNDALKLWTLWKSVGTTGIEAIVDQQFDLADYALQYVKNHPDYTVYSHEDSVSVCFNYKDIPADKLCTDLYEHNELMVGFGQFDGEEFVRLVTVNGTMVQEDLSNFFKTLEEFAAKNYN